MRRQQRHVWLVGVAVSALLVTLLPQSTATAQEAGPAGDVDVRVEVVADGLDVPRGLAYDPLLRRVVVAEAGNAAGNDGACANDTFGNVYCYGDTGAVFQYSERSWLPSGRIAEGLPSMWLPAFEGVYEVVLGLADVDLPFGTGPVVGVFGLHGPPEFRDELAQEHPGANNLGTAAWILPHGKVRTIADFVEFEAQENPHPRLIDSNPFGVLAEGPKLTVADAAGNYLARADLGGRIDVLAVIPNRHDPDTGIDREGVPTSVVRGTDGALYISELSGAFAPAGFARIWRLDAGGELGLYADGFTNIADMALDAEGRLMVLEISQHGFYQNPLPDGDRTGRLVRVEPDGSQTTLLTEPLENPGGIVQARGDTFYVTNRSAHLGGDGQLLRVTVDG